MLKRRIIPIELLDSGRLVKTRMFKSPRDVGDPIKSSKVYSNQDADELLFLNITRNDRSAASLIETVARIATECFVPLSAGGGITSFEDAARLIEVGADKVVINTAAYRDPKLIGSIAQAFGRQAVVVGVDVLSEGTDYSLWSGCGARFENVRLERHVQNAISAGAGEIMIQSIDRDGVMGGYDLDLVRRVTAVSNVPVIAAAGAGHFLHLKEVFEAGADAAACGSLFNFGDNNPLRAKAYLKNHNIPLKRL
jgi:cyclase